MTTLLGIRANGEDEGVVLVADTQLNIADIKKETSKVWIGKNYALGFAGVLDKYLEGLFSYLSGRRDFQSYLRYVSGIRDEKLLKDLVISYNRPYREIARQVQELLSGKRGAQSEIEKAIVKSFKREDTPNNEIDAYFRNLFKPATESISPLSTAVKLKYFAELAILNRYSLKKNVEFDDTTEFLIASKEDLGLYHVDCFGGIRTVSPEQELEYLALGTGKELVEKYFDNVDYAEDSYIKEKAGDKINLDNVSVRVACALAIGALKRGLQDKDSGAPIEVVTIRKTAITSYLSLMREKLNRAEYEGYDTILEKETPPKMTEEETENSSD